MESLEDLKEKKIFVIDDTVTIHRLLSRQLKELGFNHVTCAISAMAAWNVLESDPSNWGMIFCDQNMPEVSGLEFLKKIREDDRFKNIIFIMLTMESDIRTVNKAIETGVNGYVLKPYTKETILKAIEQSQHESPEEGEEKKSSA